jgi:hypothetical protein
MTEEQLKAVPRFVSLPIYEEGDPQADTITTVAGAGRYKSIRECNSLRDVQRCLKNPRLVPLGALRAAYDGKAVVVAYFGEQP